MELRVLMEGRFLRVARIKSPTVEPTHVERAFRAVEITPKVRSFRFVAGVDPMFPHRGEGLEFEAGDLRVRRIRIVLEDVASSCGEDFSRIFFLCPPKEKYPRKVFSTGARHIL